MCIGTLSNMQNSTQSASRPLFTEAETTALESMGTVIRFPAGSMLVEEGEETDFVLHLLTGFVKVVKGSQGRIMGLRGPGEVVAEMASIIVGPRNASVHTVGDVTARHIPAESWVAFLHEHPRAMFAQLRAAELRLAEATIKSAESLLGSEQKLAKALVELAASGVGEAEAGAIALRFNQKELADIAGVSRESVVQVIRHFKSAGIVSTGRHVTRILDQASLKAVADGTATVART